MGNNIIHLAGRNTGANKLLITHTDMDGVGCAVIFLKCYPQAQVLFVDYHEVNQAVNDMLDKDEGWDIMISDMSVDADTARRLDQRGRVSLLDHHATAKWLEETYDWAVVDLNKCGTRLVFEVLSQYFHINDYTEFVSIVEDWDLWGRATGNSEPGQTAMEYQFLFDFIGKYRFFDRMVRSPQMDDNDDLIATIMYEKFEEYAEQSVNITQVYMADGYRVGITIADQFTSLLGNHIVRALDLEYVMIINPREGKGSLRGKGNIHLGELARQAGGGGHRQAAGFPLGTQSAVDLVNSVERGD